MQICSYLVKKIFLEGYLYDKGLLIFQLILIRDKCIVYINWKSELQLQVKLFARTENGASDLK